MIHEAEYPGEYPGFSENNNLRCKIFHRLCEKTQKQWTAKSSRQNSKGYKGYKMTFKNLAEFHDCIKTFLKK